MINGDLGRYAHGTNLLTARIVSHNTTNSAGQTAEIVVDQLPIRREGRTF